MPYKLIVSDVDGCLAPEESAAWNFDSFSRLARLCRGDGHDRTVPLTLCTGRPQPYVEVLMKLLDIRLPAICEGGAVFYSLADNRSYYGPGVTDELLRELHAVRDFVQTDLVKRYPDAVYQFGKEAQMSVYCEDPDRIPVLADEVRGFAARFDDDPIDVSATRYYLNISLRGVDKGTALRRLMDDLGVSRDDVAAIGDTAGDLPLREAASFFAAPSNASAEIAAKADYLSPYSDVEGVIDFLQRVMR